MLSNPKKWALLIALCMSCLLTGCAKRDLAPEIQFAQDEVEQFDKEIGQFDW